MNPDARPDQLVGLRLAVVRSFGDQQREQCFRGPKQAIATLIEDFRLLWRHHRTDHMEERRIGRWS